MDAAVVVLRRRHELLPNVLAQALVREGRAAEAVPILREALRIRQVSTPGHWRIAEAQSALAEALTRVGQHEEAEGLLTRAEARIQDGVGEFGPLRLQTRARRALLTARSR